MTALKKREYHQSEINMFLKCGKQWEFRYERGIVTPPTAALTLGSAVDVSVTKNLAQKVSSKKDLSIEEVLETYSSDFDKRAPSTVWDGEDVGKQKDMGTQMIRLYHERVAPNVRPATVQEKFVIELDAPYNIGGTIDLTEEDRIVADTKTSKNKYADDAVSRALQPAIYDFAYEALRGVKAKAFRYDVLIKPTAKKPAELQQVSARVTEADRIHLFDTINNVHTAIEAGVAMPAPEGAWWCSKDWCGYWSMCKGKGARK